jgi:hypothetical protein
MHVVRAQSFRLVMAALVVGIATSPAYAYLDPGTGSIVLQVLLGGFAGLALAGKLYWNKLLSFLGLKKKTLQTTSIEDERKPKANARSRT